MHGSSTVYKQKQLWVFMCENNSGWTFGVGSVIMAYGRILVRSNGLKLKCLNDEFVYYKHTAFHFIRC